MTTSHPRLIIAFAGGKGAVGMPDYEFRAFLNNNFPDLHKVFVRDNSHVKGGQFYFRGMKISDDSETQWSGSQSTSLEENLELLKKIHNQANYETTIFLGNSSGAFAALLYGLLLNVDEVIAFGPFTIITQKYSKNRELHYIDIIKRLWKHQPTHDYYDLYKLAETNDTTKVSLIYGSASSHDKKQAHHLKGLANISIRDVDNAGHGDCIIVCRNNGELKKMIEEAMISYKSMLE